MTAFTSPNNKKGGAMLFDATSTLSNWLDAGLAAIAGAVATFMGLRRRFSKDTASIAHDKAETSLIATLMAERDMAMKHAREAWDQRIEDARKLARLEALLEARDLEVARLRDELFSLRMHIRKLSAIAVRLDPQAAHLLNIDAHSDGIEPNPTPKEQL